MKINKKKRRKTLKIKVSSNNIKIKTLFSQFFKEEQT
jgi:hypothetical protein